MNILFFLTPKSETAFLSADSTVRQGLEKMKHYGYSAIPLIDEQGHYVGTITEGDFLWGVVNNIQTGIRDVDHISLKEINRKCDLQPVHINETIEALFERALNQNFVPVVDDKEIFIGIVRRKEIMQYCFERVIGSKEK
ncbi:MAG: CBS domain-containing protein [Lachnospiraceae bacterium]|nr:CBS domain-containing protein [Lachnospiraceae bacterium]